MPSSPGTSFEVLETELVLRLLVGVFDPPAILDNPNEVLLRRRLAGRLAKNTCAGTAAPIGHSAISQKATGGSALALVRRARRPRQTANRLDTGPCCPTARSRCEKTPAARTPIRPRSPRPLRVPLGGRGHYTPPDRVAPFPWGSSGGYVVGVARRAPTSVWGTERRFPISPTRPTRTSLEPNLVRIVVATTAPRRRRRAVHEHR
jgi:hypothetical protein